MGKRLAVVVLAALAFALAASPADACLCGSGPVCRALWTTDAVFSGEVLDITDAAGARTIGRAKNRVVRIQVLDVWRGDVSGVVEIRSGVPDGECDYLFQKGRRYLVYADAAGERLTATICNRTRPLENASADLAYFNTTLSRSLPAGHVFGTVTYKAIEPRQRDKAAAGKAVALSNPERRWTTTTGQDGGYRFYGIPAGRYSLTVSETSASDAVLASRNVLLADSRGCEAVSFALTPTAIPIPRRE